MGVIRAYLDHDRSAVSSGDLHGENFAEQRHKGNRMFPRLPCEIRDAARFRERSEDHLLQH